LKTEYRESIKKERHLKETSKRAKTRGALR